MDHYGIGAAAVGSFNVYLLGARGTGRTTSLVESVKDGDRVVFLHTKEAQRVQRLCAERGVQITCITADPISPEHLFTRGPSTGRTLFDHSWVEAYYMNAIHRAGSDLDRFERELSGDCESRETRRKHEEANKWSLFQPYRP